MITFPVTPEAFIAYQEKLTGNAYGSFMRELLSGYVELFNYSYEDGLKGHEPINIAKDTAEFYACENKLEHLERPDIQHFYACVQYWCNRAYQAGVEKNSKPGG